MKKPKINPRELVFAASTVGALMANAQGSVFSDTEAKALEDLIDLREKPQGVSSKQEEVIAKREKEGVENATPRQQEEYKRLIQKRDNPKELSPTQHERIKELETKRDAPFQLSSTAKAMVLERWLKFEHGIIKSLDDIYTIRKGKMVEQDIFALLDKVHPAKRMRISFKDMLAKRESAFISNDWVRGIPDTFLDHEGIIEDAKAPFTITNFIKTSVTRNEKAQVQSYMDMLDVDKARIAKVFIDTPMELVTKLLKRKWYGMDEDLRPEGAEPSEEYAMAERAVLSLHKRPQGASDEDMIKLFEFDRDQEYIDELKRRVEFARDYYAELCELGLGGIDPKIMEQAHKR